MMSGSMINQDQSSQNPSIDGEKALAADASWGRSSLFLASMATSRATQALVGSPILV